MKQLEVLFDQVEQQKPVSTPLLQQLRSIKQEYPDALLLFRCGDFYEAYDEDAMEASKILGLTLTWMRDFENKKERISLAGFPFHALDIYLPRLVRAGKRVAICDTIS